MRSKINNQILKVFALVLAGCAGSGSNAGGIIAGVISSAPKMQAAPIATTRPCQIMIFPFATSTADVTLNQGLGARLYRNYSGVSVASTGVKNITSSTAFLSKKTAQQVVDQTNNYFSQQGWNSTNPAS